MKKLLLISLGLFAAIALQAQISPSQIVAQNVNPGVNEFQPLGWTTSLPISALGLYTGNANTGIAAGSNPAAADNIIYSTPDGLSLGILFYCNVAGYEGWYQGDYTPANSFCLPLDRPFWIKRKASTSFTWLLPAPGLVRLLNAPDCYPVLGCFTPASSHAPGSPGLVTYDDNWVYFCVSQDYWRRAPLQEF